MRIRFLALFTLIFMVTTIFGQDFGQDYILNKLNADINTPNYNETNPIVSEDGKKLYFTRVGSPDFNKTIWLDSVDVSTTLDEYAYNSMLRNVYSEIAETYIENPSSSELNQDIWIAKTVKEDFDVLEHPTSPINNALPNSVCSFTESTNELIVLNQFSKKGGMQKGFSTILKKDDIWQDPLPLIIDGFDNITSGVGISSTMSNDGTVLIISMPRYDSYGDNDLYISTKKENGTWTTPINLGPEVNTPYREVTPHLSADKKKLFFASNRPRGVGGMDICYIERNDTISWSNWSLVRVFNPPINSKYDDSQPYFNLETGKIYFSSKRDGSSDIFSVKIAPEIPREIVIKGKIYNSNTKKVEYGKVLFGDISIPYFEHYVDARDGSYTLTIPQGKKIKITAQKGGYINHEIELYYESDKRYNAEQTLDLYIDPIEKGAEITLDPIYFERTKAIILEKSFITLSSLAKILQKYPKIKVEIGGHTDNQNDVNLLMKLSEERAVAVKSFLTKNGVKSDRIQTKGFGPTQPKLKGDDEDSRSQNRRVEVKITDLDQ
jgi:OmpA-OmpF porin, OOP family